MGAAGVTPAFTRPVLLACANVLMAVTAVLRVSTKPCNSDWLSTPVPLALVAAMAARMAATLSDVTPVIPRACNCATDTVPVPAALAMTALTALAKVCTSATVSTSAVTLLPTTSSSNLSFTPAVTPVTPMATYCAAVGLLLVLASAAAPLASVKTAL